MKRQLDSDGYMYDRKLSDSYRGTTPQQPFSSMTYRLELDTSILCNNSQITHFQNLFGILRWIIELGRIDIAYEVSCLSRYLASPRTGHLIQDLHIFKFLDIHHENTIALDPTKILVPNPTDNSICSRIQSMRMVYGNVTEEIPHDAPKPLGRSIQINCFVDASHANDMMTRRSQTGILIFCNMALVI